MSRRRIRLIMGLCFLVAGVWLLRRAVAPPTPAASDAPLLSTISDQQPPSLYDKQPSLTDSASGGGEHELLQCHTEANAEYGGNVVGWGSQHFTESADACCEACRKKAGCSIWVW